MNTYYIGSIPISDELYHHGIKGQKWGIRRYQNEDGTLTEAGKARYGGDITKASGKFVKKQVRAAIKSGSLKNADKIAKKVGDEVMKTEEGKRFTELTEKYSKAAKDLSELYGREVSYNLYGEQAIEYALAQKRFLEKVNEFTNKHKDEMASATLKDLGYTDSEKARKYLNKYM